MKKTYVVVDIEADGPVPGLYSMLSIGAVACSPEDGVIDEFHLNLEPLPDASQHPSTMEFWAKHESVWQEIHKDPIPPKQAMEEFANWVQSLPDQIVFASHGLELDKGYIRWYLWRFLQHDPFIMYDDNVVSGLSLDLPSLISGRLKLDIEASTRNDGINNDAYPTSVHHSHHPLDDARGYAEVLLHYLRD